MVRRHGACTPTLRGAAKKMMVRIAQNSSELLRAGQNEVGFYRTEPTELEDGGKSAQKCAKNRQEEKEWPIAFWNRGLADSIANPDGPGCRSSTANSRGSGDSEFGFSNVMLVI